jgi:hypothetical protein
LPTGFDKAPDTRCAQSYGFAASVARFCAQAT